MKQELSWTEIDPSDWTAEQHLVSSVLQFSSVADVEKDVYSECNDCVSNSIWCISFYSVVYEGAEVDALN